MKIKLVAIVILFLIIAVGAWQASILHRTSTQAVAININTLTCKSTPFLNTLKADVSAAQAKFDVISFETKNAKFAVDTQIKAISKKTTDIALQQNVIKVASTTLSQKNTVYNTARLRVSAPTSALTAKQLDGLKKAEIVAKDAMEASVRKLESEQKKLKDLIAQKTDMEKELGALQTAYALYVVKPGQKLSVVQEERLQALNKATLAYNTTVTQTKNLKECSEGDE